MPFVLSRGYGKGFHRDESPYANSRREKAKLMLVLTIGKNATRRWGAFDAG
jgi:hypothetical protein